MGIQSYQMKVINNEGTLTMHEKSKENESEKPNKVELLFTRNFSVHE